MIAVICVMALVIFFLLHIVWQMHIDIQALSTSLRLQRKVHAKEKARNREVVDRINLKADYYISYQRGLLRSHNIP